MLSSNIAVRDSRLLRTGVGLSDILAPSALLEDAVDHPADSGHSTRFRTTRSESRDFGRRGAIHSSCKRWWPFTPATLPVSAPLSSLVPLGQSLSLDAIVHHRVVDQPTHRLDILRLLPLVDHHSSILGLGNASPLSPTLCFN